MPRPQVLLVHPDAAAAEALAERLAGDGLAVRSGRHLGDLPRLLRETDPDAVLLPADAGPATLAALLRLIDQDCPSAAVCRIGASLDLERTRALVTAAAGLGRPAVLLVGDSLPGQQPVADALRGAGLRVLRAGSGEEALALCAEVLPDLALIDLHLPGIDGVATLSRLHRDPRLAALPVVVLAASGADPAIARALDGGALDFLVTPLAPRLLIETVAHVRLRRQAVGV